MSRMRFSFVLLAAGVCFLANVAIAQPDPPGVNPSHYWTYSPSYGGHYQPQFIQVRDQFFQSFTPVYLDTLERFLNWVHKNGSPVPDTLIHYTWWNIVNKLPNSASTILTNQFGSFPAQIGDLQFMLVPAWKNQPGPTGSPLANHYLCYKAFGGPPPPQILDLVDEWRHDVQQLGPIDYLCTPCWKQHNGQVFPAIDELTHLAMYRITPTSERFFPYIQDQFFSGTCDVLQQPYEYLLVPTLKQLIVTDVKKSTWGKVKMLYR